MKVVLLMEDSFFSGVDFSEVRKGNPGVGGTEFEIALLGDLLTKETEFETCILHYNPANTFDKAVKTVIVSPSKLWDNLEKDDIFIFRSGKDEHWYNMLEKCSIKGVCWAHNFLDYEEIKSARRCSMLKRIVCVGRQEYEHYIDDNIINKMTYIYNIIPVIDRQELYDRTNYKEVTYTGSLVKLKGFHILAKYWKDIVHAVPEARLNIIGTGKLYKRDSEFGPYGIADVEYERLFMPYLTDEHGNILDSVTFYGILGEEKNDIYKRTTVGIENPSADTETFGLSGVEMSLMGIPVVTKAQNGFLDTVPDNISGKLFEKEVCFPAYIIELLKDFEKNKALGKSGREFVLSNFTAEQILPQWCSCLSGIADNIEAEKLKRVSFPNKDSKRLRMLLYCCHNNSLLEWIPSSHAIIHLLKIIKKGLMSIIGRK